LTLAYAALLREPTLALHVRPGEEEAATLLCEWRAFGDHLPLEMISSPSRAIVPPLVHYLRALHSQRPTTVRNITTAAAPAMPCDKRGVDRISSGLALDAERAHHRRDRLPPPSPDGRAARAGIGSPA
jgi:hypothetical protein